MKNVDKAVIPQSNSSAFKAMAMFLAIKKTMNIDRILTVALMIGEKIDW